MVAGALVVRDRQSVLIDVPELLAQANARVGS